MIITTILTKIANLILSKDTTIKEKYNDLNVDTNRQKICMYWVEGIAKPVRKGDKPLNRKQGTLSLETREKIIQSFMYDGFIVNCYEEYI